MKITSLFPLKKNNEQNQLPEVAISTPKKALKRLEEQNQQNEILSRRQEILNNASTTTIPMNELEHDTPLTINNGPALNKPESRGPSILEEQSNYNKKGFNLPVEGEETQSPYIEDVPQITNNNYGEDYLNPPLPVQTKEGIEIEEDLDEELEPDNDIEQEYDPFDESMSETGFTELEVTLIDGKTLRYIFNIGKSKFEQQWLDEIYSIGIFTAKDIYGNLVTLSPKGKNTVAFIIKEGILPNE
ncbi:hypothetical protein [Lysinibacillus xylanilyticus]|uniref:hypothetical protein n=2 Tax=Lysinibacillus xylanilyticus TaxID=582475 RepID=UPI00381ED1C0